MTCHFAVLLNVLSESPCKAGNHSKQAVTLNLAAV